MGNLDEFQQMVLRELFEIKCELATLKERSRIWGAVGGLIGGGFIALITDFLRR